MAAARSHLGGFQGRSTRHRYLGSPGTGASDTAHYAKSAAHTDYPLSQTRAQGTNIGALLPPVGLFAAIAYFRHGLLDVRVSGLVGLGFVFGALGGASVVQHVPQVWLTRAFATLLLYVAAQLVCADPNRKPGAGLPGIHASAGLSGIYFLRKLLGRKPSPPRPPGPPSEDTD